MATQIEWERRFRPAVANYKSAEVVLVELFMELESSGEWRKFKSKPVTFFNMMQDPQCVNSCGYTMEKYTVVKNLVVVLGRDLLIEIGIPAALVWMSLRDNPPVRDLEDARAMYIEAVRGWIRKNGRRPGSKSARRVGKLNVIENMLPPESVLPSELHQLKQALLRCQTECSRWMRIAGDRQRTINELRRKQRASKAA